MSTFLSRFSFCERYLIIDSNTTPFYLLKNRTNQNIPYFNVLVLILYRPFSSYSARCHIVNYIKEFLITRRSLRKSFPRNQNCTPILIQCRIKRVCSFFLQMLFIKGILLSSFNENGFRRVFQMLYDFRAISQMIDQCVGHTTIELMRLRSVSSL